MSDTKLLFSGHVTTQEEFIFQWDHAHDLGLSSLSGHVTPCHVTTQEFMLLIFTLCVA